jgi:hypothetical protein
MRVSPDRTEFFGARMAGHDIGDIDRYLAELRRFTMLDHAPEITCPTLIIEADHDFAGGGGQSLHDKLTAPSHCAGASPPGGFTRPTRLAGHSPTTSGRPTSTP